MITSPIEQLPLSILGELLTQLNKITGSTIPNRKDLPFIKKQAASLACTSKTMCDAIHSYAVTSIFLSSISTKYEIMPIEIASLCYTRGMHEWLWRYIESCGYDKTYEQIQEIQTIATEVLKETRDAGLTFDYMDGKEKRNYPYNYHFPTKSGIALNIYHKLPKFIDSPFGAISLYSSKKSVEIEPHNDSLSVSELFIHKLGAVFNKVDHSGNLCLHKLFNEKTDSIDEIEKKSSNEKIRHIEAQDIKQISHADCLEKIGTQNLFGAPYDDLFFKYEIKQVNGKEVSPLLFFSPNESKNSVLCLEMIWEMLQKGRLSPYCPIVKEPIAVSSATTNRPNPQDFTRVSEIPSWAFKRIESLFQPPIDTNCQTNKGQIAPIKKLSFHRWSDTNFFNNLVCATHSFLSEENKIETKIQSDTELVLHFNTDSISLEAIKIALNSVIEKLSTSWVPCTLKEYSERVQYESEEEYTLFVKDVNNCVPNELDLFYRIQRELDLNTTLSLPDNLWKIGNYRKMYIWIKNDALEKTLKLLNFV